MNDSDSHLQTSTLDVENQLGCDGPSLAEENPVLTGADVARPLTALVADRMPRFCPWQRNHGVESVWGSSLIEDNTDGAFSLHWLGGIALWAAVTHLFRPRHLIGEDQLASEGPSLVEENPSLAVTDESMVTGSSCG